jgi:non-canonical purine NTP pyrophosphatase (RdgB/HAM1 family)
MKQNITFITGNPSKADQLSRYLNIAMNHQAVDLPEIQSLDLLEIVEHKTREAFKIVQSPVLVEDTSLTFHALGKLPGPFIKWFLGELDNQGLCRLLDGYADRSATARVLFGYFDGHELKTFAGETKGTIADQPRGKNGFGWDPIFIPNGSQKTRAEMTQDEQSAMSMRRIALEKLEQYLSKN